MISADSDSRDPGRDAFCELRDEFADALLQDPTRTVATPAYASERRTAADVLRIEFTLRESGRPHFEEMLRFISHAAQHSRCSDTRLRGMQIIAAAADRHAELNRDALMRDIASGASS